MKTIMISLLICICSATISAQTIYVDSNTGNDNNAGTKEAPLYSVKKAAEFIRSSDNNVWTMKLNPGVYAIDNQVTISTEKETINQRIVIEASILPDDTAWTPEKMPIVVCIAKMPEHEYHYQTSLLIEASRVTIRGIKFPGYVYPNTRYFPIARFNKACTDLFIEQCLFVGNEDASHLQVGIIAHGNQIRADHCVFYNIRNTLVFWQDAGDSAKTGNGITHSIIYGATQSGIWTALPDKDFIFKNNVVAKCKNFWITNQENPTIYTMENCVVVDNEHYQAVAGETVVPKSFEINEKNVIKEGSISLRPKGEPMHADLPVDYLHVMPGTLGYELGAGLFETRK